MASQELHNSTSKICRRPPSGVEGARRAVTLRGQSDAPTNRGGVGELALLGSPESGRGAASSGRGSPQPDDPWPAGLSRSRGVTAGGESRLGAVLSASPRISRVPGARPSRRGRRWWRVTNPGGRSELLHDGEPVGRSPLVKPGGTVQFRPANCSCLCVVPRATGKCASPEGRCMRPSASGEAGPARDRRARSDAIWTLRRRNQLRVRAVRGHVLIHGFERHREGAHRAPPNPRALVEAAANHADGCRAQRGGRYPTGIVDAELFGKTVRKLYPTRGVPEAPGSRRGRADRSTLFLDEVPRSCPPPVQQPPFASRARTAGTTSAWARATAGGGRNPSPDRRHQPARSRSSRRDLRARLPVSCSRCPELNDSPRTTIPLLVRHPASGDSPGRTRASPDAIFPERKLGRQEPSVSLAFLRGARHPHLPHPRARARGPPLEGDRRRGRGSELDLPDVVGKVELEGADRPGAASPERDGRCFERQGERRSHTRKKIRAALDAHNGQGGAHVGAPLGLTNRYVLRRLIAKVRYRGPPRKPRR